jgi:hypothetical protein
LNFIDKKSTDFLILNRQKVFSSKSVIWEKTWFNNKTTLNIFLKYKKNSLSL